jgi:hypothetical protein
MGINLDTLRPEPCVEGYSTPGGYSYRAVKPIALEKVMSISRLLQQQDFREQGASLSGIGGVETGGDAAEFILLGCDTVQVRALRRARHIRRGGVAAATLLASWADAVVLDISYELQQPIQDMGAWWLFKVQCWPPGCCM